MTIDEKSSVEDSDEVAVEDDSAAIAPPGDERAFRRRIMMQRSTFGPALLALLVFAALALAGVLYYFQYRPDQQTDARVQETVLAAARDGTVALLSYSPTTLDSDFANAKSRLTGDFLDYYNQFTAQVVTPAATQKKVQTSATVVRSAVTELQPTSAKVLVFIDQNTTSTDKPQTNLTSSSVLVTLDKVNDAWLISSFDPVAA